MNPRQIAKMILPPIAIEVMKSLIRHRHLRQYLHGKRIPWSAGWKTYRRKVIIQSLKDMDLLERFRYKASLTSSYGIGIDERCIEYPWLFAHLDDKRDVLLDAGSTLNQDFIVDHRLFKRKRVHIITLAPDWNCFWQRGISYIFHDLRDIPVRDGFYDTVVCISTLEHVGCDTRPFTQEKMGYKPAPGDFAVVMKELRRVLKPHGTMFLTVPFGSYRHMGVLQQFDRNLLHEAVAAFGDVSELTEAFYKYSRNGWDIADIADCTECEYVEDSVKVWAYGKRPDAYMVESDMAAAARAVACVKLVKGG